MHGLDTSNVSSRVESSRAKWNLSLTGQFADKLTHGQSSGRLVHSPIVNFKSHEITILYLYIKPNGNSLDKLRHLRSVAYSVELVLLNNCQIFGGGADLDCYPIIYSNFKSNISAN